MDVLQIGVICDLFFPWVYLGTSLLYLSIASRIWHFCVGFVLLPNWSYLNLPSRQIVLPFVAPILKNGYLSMIFIVNSIYVIYHKRVHDHSTLWCPPCNNMWYHGQTVGDWVLPHKYRSCNIIFFSNIIPHLIYIHKILVE